MFYDIMIEKGVVLKVQLLGGGEGGEKRRDSVPSGTVFWGYLKSLWNLQKWSKEKKY